jgi:hypothetical protein
MAEVTRKQESGGSALQWELTTRGSLDEIAGFVEQYGGVQRIVRHLSSPYTVKDYAVFPQSSAIYFMDGFSSATVKFRGGDQQITMDFTDASTSISASMPFLHDDALCQQGLFVPVPPPLEPVAYLPKRTPDRDTRDTTSILLQVVSMDMRSKDNTSRLLIGLPYAERYPRLFNGGAGFTYGARTGASYGVVQSLTEIVDASGRRDVNSNGFPARSFFGIYHIVETPIGALFNKIPTQMELQPSKEGKLALALPPIPFWYELINGPIPLYDVDKPDGEPVADLVRAAHGSRSAATTANLEAWPWHTPHLAGPGPQS